MIEQGTVSSHQFANDADPSSPNKPHIHLPW
jgi:hypothetical protein